MRNIFRHITFLSPFLLLLICFGKCIPVQAQTSPINTTKIISLLSNQYKNGIALDYNLVEEIVKSGESKNIFRELESKADDHHLKAMCCLLKASVIYIEDIKPDNNKTKEYRASEAAKKEILALGAKAINEAYLSGDDRLIAQTSNIYGQKCMVLKEMDLAVTYTINGLELNEKLGIKNSPWDYVAVGEILYRIREYNECIKNSVKAFKMLQPLKDSIRMMFSSNTTALAYHRLKLYDSAFYWYQTSLKFADGLNNKIWNGLIGGNMGQIYYELGQYDTALALFQKDYQFSKEGELYDNAANSLQWAARTQLRLKNKTVALQNVREALSLLGHTPEMFYLRNTYYTATNVFKELGAYDSAFYYNNKYVALNDSLERVIALSGLAVSKARANDEKSRYRIQSLQKEKEKQVLLRNLLIVTIIMLGVIGFLVITRQRLKTRLHLERMEQEIASAKEQMKMFTGNIIEKTALVEKLEEQLKNKEASAEQKILMNELSRQTILTEDDWNQFKTLFEKIYPGFFINLKQKTPDITLAEQRMAALTRLQLTTKQMASMLGISIDSVHKTRQRLRQRFNLTTENNLEEFIAAI